MTGTGDSASLEGSPHPTGGYTSSRTVDGPDNSHTIEYLLDDRLHRLDGPAVTQYLGEDTDEVTFVEWRYKGRLHRDDGPAFTGWKGDVVVTERWYRGGELHRDDGPAVIRYSESYPVREEEWYSNGSLSRGDDEPALVWYDEAGDSVHQEWHESGRLFRPGAPDEFSTSTEYGDYPARTWYGADGEPRLRNHPGPYPSPLSDALAQEAGLGRNELVDWLEALDELASSKQSGELVRELVAAGVTAGQALRAARGFITTCDGFREVLLRGAPMDQVREWEKGQRS